MAICARRCTDTREPKDPAVERGSLPGSSSSTLLRPSPLLTTLERLPRASPFKDAPLFLRAWPVGGFDKRTGVELLEPEPDATATLVPFVEFDRTVEFRLTGIGIPEERRSFLRWAVELDASATGDIVDGRMRRGGVVCGQYRVASRGYIWTGRWFKKRRGRLLLL